MASSHCQGPQYPAEGGAKISWDPTASVTAQGAGGGLATCDPTQSVSTQGTLGQLISLEGPEGHSVLLLPQGGTTSQLTSSNW